MRVMGHEILARYFGRPEDLEARILEASASPRKAQTYLPHEPQTKEGTEMEFRERRKKHKGR